MAVQSCGLHWWWISHDVAKSAAMRLEQAFGSRCVHGATGHDDRRLDATPGRVDHPPSFGSTEARGLHHDALTPVHELLVPGPEIDHEVSVDLAQTDHRSGSDRIERELGCRAGLHAGGAGDRLRADSQENAHVAR